MPRLKPNPRVEARRAQAKRMCVAGFGLRRDNQTGAMVYVPAEQAAEASRANLRGSSFNIDDRTILSADGSDDDRIEKLLKEKGL